jgi:hypothetical protein
MRPATRYSLQSLAANLALAFVCAGLFVGLPFGTLTNALAAAVLWIVGGFFIDRWHLSRLSAEDRAREMRRRADSEL